MRRSSALFAAVWLAFAALPAAAEPSEKPPAAAPKSEQSATEHSIAIDGKPIAYTATAGTLIVPDAKGEPAASIGYVAYVKKGAEGAARPITFAFNGGPGSSSVWLHMGALGPRRIVTVDAGPTPPPPYKVVDNGSSILDRTDLVMIDPVGTGLSHAVGERKDKDFWGVDQDIESVSRFIKQYVSENGRWRSPKYLLGESYGSTRAGGIVDYLQQRENMAFNGVVLVSVALDLEAIFAWPGNDRPYPLILPTFAAVAAYHKVLPEAPADLGKFLDEVRQFALGEYEDAIEKGDTLGAEEKARVAAKLHRYTGLSADYWTKANLRVRESQFSQELLRDRGEIAARLDARFRGRIFNLLAEEAEYDPQSEAISGAFTAAYLDYLNGELKFGSGKSYQILNFEAAPSWDFKHNAGFFVPIPTPNTGIDLGRAMTLNPHLRLLVLNGLYDLATPFFATEQMIDHLGLGPELRRNIAMKYYEAGHMMYLREADLKQMKADLAAFYDQAAK